MKIRFMENKIPLPINPATAHDLLPVTGCGRVAQCENKYNVKDTSWQSMIPRVQVQVNISTPHNVKCFIFTVYTRHSPTIFRLSASSPSLSSPPSITESNQHLLDQEPGELIIFKTIVIAGNKYDHLPTRKKICQQSRPSNRWQLERGAIIM